MGEVEREKRKRKPLHPLVHFLHGYNDQDCSRLNPEARIPSGSPLWVTEAQTLVPSPGFFFPDTLSGSSILSGVARTQTGPLMNAYTLVNDLTQYATTLASTGIFIINIIP